MKKNYTLKFTLAMLVVLLVSVVSFVGVYKGKNLLKEYSLGKDFSQRKIVTFSVVEEPASEENGENQNNEANNEANKEESYKKAKNILAKRIVEMGVDDFEIRLNEEDGTIDIETSEDVDTSYLSQIVSKGKISVKNQSTGEVVVDSKGFKNASTKIDSTTYTKPIVLLNIKFTNSAKNTFKNANTKYTDSEGNESDATYSVDLDGQTLYSDTASNFVSSAKNGALDLVLGQNDNAEEIEKDYQSARVLISLINNDELPVSYQIDNVQVVKSSTNIKTIVIIACIIGALMLVFAIFKFKGKSVLPVVSLVGLVATILLVFRYTNVKITLFTILGIAVVVAFNYILILKNLKNDKSFKHNFVDMLNVIVPCIIIAIVFCCSPYLQVASLGMSIFWGIIVMFIYNLAITRVLINK